MGHNPPTSPSTTLDQGDKMKKLITGTLLLASFHAEANFSAHEWGTFTSVVNKDGVQLQGLHHEEEALPNFVYDLSRVESTNTQPNFPGFPRGGGGPPTRGFTPLSMNLMPIPTFTEKITQKMETPVIYFYSEKEVNVKIRVDFPEGVISQWFPNVSKVNPSEEAKNGYGVWDIKVLETKTASLPRTSGNSIWNPSRETAANIIKVKSELEKLIFYRGLGDFKTALHVKEDQGKITITNNSAQNIKGLILLNHNSKKNELLHIKELEAGSSKEIKSKSFSKFPSFETYKAEAKKIIVKDLVHSGLYKDESIAMVNTWEGGYFQTKGLRLLYVLPREWTEEILPIKITPAPKALVRTLVGRVEILSTEDDKKILNFIKTGNLNPFNINGREMKGLGHFPEPKLRRALELTNDLEVKRKINNLINQMNRGFLN